MFQVGINRSIPLLAEGAYLGRSRGLAPTFKPHGLRAHATGLPLKGAGYYHLIPRG